MTLQPGKDFENGADQKKKKSAGAGQDVGVGTGYKWRTLWVGKDFGILKDFNGKRWSWARFWCWEKLYRKCARVGKDFGVEKDFKLTALGLEGFWNWERL